LVDRKVAGDPTLDKFLKNNVRGRDTYLRPTVARVVNFHRNARAHHFGCAQFKTCQGVPGNVRLCNYLFFHHLQDFILYRLFLRRATRQCESGDSKRDDGKSNVTGH
jgi:hypothetical protein